MRVAALRDMRRRFMFNQYELNRRLLKTLTYNRTLPLEVRMKAQHELTALPRNSTAHRIHNFCIWTGRSRAVVRPFRLNRLKFREFIAEGFLPGVRKHSW
eukprot:TRINITY_DN7545_c0_g1_i1.p1 TRINITY_DN7545_c0_g1~~TRINITY_DN7545_c0_g1_i1.p1  ORF type:complete len:100 (+),score=7.84 TRINITY_DN7545_c0_g1_i1:90-389(+)